MAEVEELQKDKKALTEEITTRLSENLQLKKRIDTLLAEADKPKE